MHDGDDSPDHHIAFDHTAPMSMKVPAPSHVFDVSASDGYALTVRRHGNPDGPRLILTHGNGFAIDAYYPFWSRLTEQFDCFVYDIRNHGWNPVDDDPFRHNVAFFVNDAKRIVRGVEGRFGPKPTVGVFHSLSTVVALHQASIGDGFDAIVLFDPPLIPPGGIPDEIQGLGGYAAAMTRKRRSHFETTEEFVSSLRSNGLFERMSHEALNILARTVLRRARDGVGYELRCPPAYEAQIAEHLFSWTMTVDFGEIRCPVKAIGADPTLPYSFIPSTSLSVLVRLDYDFLPGTSHLLQLEEPEGCAALMVGFLKEHGLA